MREALKDGYVFVLPTTPGPAPPAAAQDGDADQEAAEYRQRCLQFAAVASLSGTPAAALPVPIPGGMPLGITLLALHKRDLALAQAAVKLGPLLAEEAAALAQEQQQAADPPRWQPAAAGADRAGGSAGAAARAGGSAAPGASSSRGLASAARQNGSGAAASEEAAAAALAYKEAGNAAYKAGRDEEAVRQYSAAIRLDPRAVYYSNRAMALLKLGRYGDAEADCDAALKLERTSKALLRRASARLCLVRGHAGCTRCRAGRILQHVRVLDGNAAWRGRQARGQHSQPSSTLQRRRATAEPARQHGCGVWPARCMPIAVLGLSLRGAVPGRLPQPASNPPHLICNPLRGMSRGPSPTLKTCWHWSPATSRQRRSWRASGRWAGPMTTTAAPWAATCRPRSDRQGPPWLWPQQLVHCS